MRPARLQRQHDLHAPLRVPGGGESLRRLPDGVDMADQFLGGGGESGDELHGAAEIPGAADGAQNRQGLGDNQLLGDFRLGGHAHAAQHAAGLHQVQRVGEDRGHAGGLQDHVVFGGGVEGGVVVAVHLGGQLPGGGNARPLGGGQVRAEPGQVVELRLPAALHVPQEHQGAHADDAAPQDQHPLVLEALGHYPAQLGEQVRRHGHGLGEAQVLQIHALRPPVEVRLVPEDVLGAGSVDGDAKFLNALAEVPVPGAGGALPAVAGAVPGDHVAHGDPGHLRPHGLHHAGPLVPEAEGIGVGRAVGAPVEVDVRAADAHVLHADQHLPPGGDGLLRLQGLDGLGGAEHVCDHRSSFSPLGWTTTFNAPFFL